MRAEIDDINRFIYDNVNNGVYRAGLAKSQEAYEQAFRNLFAAFDELEARLSRQRWLVGGRFTEADLRLFPTLIRFDTVYYLLFKCNLRRLSDYHNLSNYTREIYQMPGVAATVDFDEDQARLLRRHAPSEPERHPAAGPRARLRSGA